MLSHSGHRPQGVVAQGVRVILIGTALALAGCVPVQSHIAIAKQHQAAARMSEAEAKAKERLYEMCEAGDQNACLYVLGPRS